MSKRNNFNDPNHGMKLHASPAVSVVEDAPVTMADDRQSSYTQADVADDTDEPNPPAHDADTGAELAYTQQQEELESEVMQAQVDNAQNDIAAPAEESIPPNPIRAAVEANPDVIREFDLSDIIVDPVANMRYSERTAKDTDVKELAESIKQDGQKVPGSVELRVDEKVYLTEGFGRFAAIQLINSTRKPEDHLKYRAVVTINGFAFATTQTTIDNAIINGKRKDLGPLDLMKITMTLKSQGMNQREIATRLGKAPAMITTYMKVGKVMEASEFVKDALVTGKISPAAVYDLTVVAPDEIEATVRKLLAESGGKKVSVADSNAKTRKAKAGKKGKTGKAGADDSESTGKTAKGRLKQRTAKQIISFVEAEATPATCEKYKDKALAKKLECLGAFVRGGGEGTFLKNLAAL